MAVKIARKPQNMKHIYTPGHPAQFPLEVSLLILANRGPKVSEIIELLDWQDQPDQYIMVLERPSPCKDLWDFFNRHDGILNEDTARFIMAQTTTAAQMCCRRGVFHRDIKLENLLINTETLEVKLIDFGCGDLLQESGYEQFCGTLDYRPPEYCTEGKYHGKPATVCLWECSYSCWCVDAFQNQETGKGLMKTPGLSLACQTVRCVLHIMLPPDSIPPEGKPFTTDLFEENPST